MIFQGRKIHHPCSVGGLLRLLLSRSSTRHISATTKTRYPAIDLKRFVLSLFLTLHIPFRQNHQDSRPTTFSLILWRSILIMGENPNFIADHFPVSIIEKLEAGAFQSLCSHLRERSDEVQNIDLMTLSGFCRNCLAKVRRLQISLRVRLS